MDVKDETKVWFQLDIYARGCHDTHYVFKAKFYNAEEYMSEVVEDIARENGIGQESGWRADWKIVDNPPRQYLEREIEYAECTLESASKKLKELQNELDRMNKEW